MKKGQIQQMESTIVLFILFFIIIMGLVFYSNVVSSKAQKMGERFDAQNAKQVVQKIVSAPELQCTSGGLVTLDCFDIQKIGTFMGAVESESSYYQKEYGAVRINVSLKHYPSLRVANEYYPFPFCNDCDTTDDSLNETVTLMDFSQAIKNDDEFNMQKFNYPILLGDYRTFPERFYYGWLTIEVYSKTK